MWIFCDLLKEKFEEKQLKERRMRRWRRQMGRRRRRGGPALLMLLPALLSNPRNRLNLQVLRVHFHCEEGQSEER